MLVSLWANRNTGKSFIAKCVQFVYKLCTIVYNCTKSEQFVYSVYKVFNFNNKDTSTLSKEQILAQKIGF